GEEQLQLHRLMCLDAVACREIVEADCLHQIVRDRTPARSQSAGFVDGGSESGCAGRQTGGLDRALDPGDERFAGCGVVDQCGDLANLREAFLHGERDVEQFVVNADASQRVARRNRGVAAGENEVGSQGDDFLGRLVGDRQSLRQRRDRRAQRIARVMTDRGDTLFRHQLDENRIEALIQRDDPRRRIRLRGRTRRSEQGSGQAQQQPHQNSTPRCALYPAWYGCFGELTSVMRSAISSKRAGASRPVMQTCLSRGRCSRKAATSAASRYSLRSAMFNSSSSTKSNCGSRIISQLRCHAWRAAAMSRCRSCTSQVKPSPITSNVTCCGKRRKKCFSPVCHLPLMNCTMPTRISQPSARATM